MGRGQSPFAARGTRQTSQRVRRCEWPVSAAKLTFGMLSHSKNARGLMRARLHWLVMCGWLVAMSLPQAVASQGATYVAGLDPAYDDLDVLVAAGAVKKILVGERPHSRAAFRRFVEEAKRHVAEHAMSDRVNEALTRLGLRFASERARGGRIRPTSARFDLVASQSPYRAQRPGADDDLDAALNPLLQRNHGRFLEDGFTAAFEGGVALEAGRWAGAVVPRVYVGAPGGPMTTRVDADIAEAYARTVLGPASLAIGRIETSWGHGTDRGPFLSNNARGLDMIRVAGDRPIRLPGLFAGLGLWNGSIALATLGDNNDNPGAKLLLVRVGGRPSQYVEFGVGYTNMQGGAGAPKATFWERIRDAALLGFQAPSPEHPTGALEISDKVLGADFRISVPSIRSALFVNFLTTDDRWFFTQPSKGYTEDAIWLVGAEAKGLGPDGRWDAHAEWRRNGARAHSHGQFTSGMTIDGRVLGDFLGPNASGLSAGLDWTGPQSRVRIRGSSDRYLGDKFAWDVVVFEDGRVSSGPWRRIEDNPDEMRRRMEVEYLRFEGWRGLETSVRVGYEHVTRFDYAEGNRQNFVAQLSLRYAW